MGPRQPHTEGTDTMSNEAEITQADRSAAQALRELLPWWDEYRNPASTAIMEQVLANHRTTEQARAVEAERARCEGIAEACRKERADTLRLNEPGSPTYYSLLGKVNEAERIRDAIAALRDPASGTGES
jgi:hypothetical protein